jgi:hypothetical protein
VSGDGTSVGIGWARGGTDETPGVLPVAPAGSDGRLRPVLPPAVVATGTTEPPWPTPAECYLAELPPLSEWSIGSAETGTMELDAAGIRAAVTGALLASPPDPEPSDWQAPLAGQDNSVGLAVRLPFNQATAVIENITAHENLVSVQLYGHPWLTGDYFPMITPCFRVTSVDDTGMEHKGVRQSAASSPSTRAANDLGSHLAVLSKPCDLHVWSGWPDSNRRPPAPKAGALTKLRHIPLRPNVAYRPAGPGSAAATMRRGMAWMLPSRLGARVPQPVRCSVRTRWPSRIPAGRAGVAQWQSASLPSWS